MDRSEGVNVAAGAILIGIGAVILGLLAPVAAIAVAAVCTALGLYLIVGGVYFGWPLPTTAAERAFRPNLRADAWALRVEGHDVIFRIGVVNDGRDDVNGALLNVVVPSFVSLMQRCNAEGHTGLEEHKGSFWREQERFWNGNVSFPGRMARLIFFRVTMPSLRDFPVQLKINSPALKDPIDVALEISPEKVMPLAGPPQIVSEQESDQGGQGS